MANSPQARKRALQNQKRRTHNHGMRSTMRSAVKKVLRAVRDGNRDAATAAYRSAEPLVDRMAGKGLIHKNRAARYKSRLNNRIRALG